MTTTEKARRSDSLYYDDISRRELCDRIAHLESEMHDAMAKEKFWHMQAEKFGLDLLQRFGGRSE